MISYALIEDRAILLRPLEDILTEKSSAPALLHDIKEGPSQLLGHLRKLLSDQASEKGMNTWAGIKIPIPSDALPFRSIIAVVGMVETPFHKLRKGNGTSLFNLREDKSPQPFSPVSFLFFHIQRSSR
jgi:hypothetical protein